MSQEVDDLKSRMNDEDSETLRLFEENVARTLRDTEDAARTKMSLDSKFWSTGTMDVKFMTSNNKGKGPERYPGVSGNALSRAEAQSGQFTPCCKS